MKPVKKKFPTTCTVYFMKISPYEISHYTVYFKHKIFTLQKFPTTAYTILYHKIFALQTFLPTILYSYTFIPQNFRFRFRNLDFPTTRYTHLIYILQKFPITFIMKNSPYENFPLHAPFYTTNFSLYENFPLYSINYFIPQNFHPMKFFPLLLHTFI